MKKSEFSPWWLIIGFIIIANAPFLIPILIVGGVFWYFFQKNNRPNLSQIFEREFGDIFEKKQKPINVPSYSKKPNISFSPSMPNLPLGKIIAATLGGLFIVLMIADGFVNIPPGFVGVISDKGRGVLPNELGVGLHPKIPFWQTATKMDVRMQVYTMSVATGEGTVVGDDSIEALTKDGQKVDVDITVQYIIDAQKADKLFSEIGTQAQIDEKIIRPPVRSIVREVITGFESKQLFNNESRTLAAQEIEAALREKYAKNDIILDSSLLRNVRFSNTYLNAIEEKQVAEQKIQKAEFEKQEAEIQKETTIIQAEAEAESIKLKGDALSSSPEVIQLQFVEKMAPQINWGILPDGALPLIDLKSLQQQ